MHNDLLVVAVILLFLTVMAAWNAVLLIPKSHRMGAIVVLGFILGGIVVSWWIQLSFTDWGRDAMDALIQRYGG